ncbi:MAG: hypothetical protein ACRCWS_02945, partial [Propionibacteriaceae bacterium]
MRYLRGGLAAFILLLLTAGIPTVLVRWGHLQWSAFTPAALLRPDDGGFVLSVITIMGWLAWLSFVAILLLDVGSRLTTLRRPQLPGARWLQTATAALVTTVVLLGPRSPALAAPPLPAPILSQQLTPDQ